MYYEPDEQNPRILDETAYQYAALHGSTHFTSEMYNAESAVIRPRNIHRGYPIIWTNQLDCPSSAIDIGKEILAETDVNPIASFLSTGNMSEVFDNLKFEIVVDVLYHTITDNRIDYSPQIFRKFVYPMQVTHNELNSADFYNQYFNNQSGAYLSLFGRDSYYISPETLQSAYCTGSLYQSETKPVASASASRISTPETVMEVDSAETPGLQVYPNPAADHVSLEFTLETAGDVNLVLYNMQGQIVQTVLSTQLAAGRHQVSSDVSAIKAGVYLYKLESSTGKPQSGRVLIE